MPKNIVICCDGTGNQYGNNNTNVVKLFEFLETSEQQKIYYDPGVGTASKLLFVIFQKMATTLAKAFGSDLQKNVEDAYYFLMNNYQDGDRIFLFGFSRGAHTVRRLASLLEECELLHQGSDNMIPYAMRLYLFDDSSEAVKAGFRRTYCRPCPVYFIGVWDTVSAVSSLFPRPKLNGEFSSEVKFAYHAVAIDEKRVQFPPNLWKTETISPHQTVEEVWFAGVHSDVGGSYKESGLSNIALKWILEKAKNAGLLIKDGSIESIACNPLAKQHRSWVGHWWFIPFHLYVLIFVVTIVLLQFVLWFGYGVWGELSWKPLEDLARIWMDYWKFLLPVMIVMIFANKMKRVIPENAKVHSSVKTRMAAGKYKPQNLLKLKQPIQWED